MSVFTQFNTQLPTKWQEFIDDRVRELKCDKQAIAMVAMDWFFERSLKDQCEAARAFDLMQKKAAADLAGLQPGEATEFVLKWAGQFVAPME